MDHMEALREYLMFVIGGLVQHPERASLVMKTGRRGETLYEVLVDQRDFPRVIGHHGQLVSAIRSLLEAAARKHGVHVALRVDPMKDETVLTGRPPAAEVDGDQDRGESD